MSKLKKLPEVIGFSKYSKSTIYLKIQRGEFPAPISLGARSVGWLESDLEKWLEERIAASGAKAQGDEQ